MTLAVLSHTVQDDEAGERLDRLIAAAFADLSRSRGKTLIQQGAVAVGTATFIDPTTPLRIVSEVEDYLISHEITSILDLVGTLEMK